MEVVHTLLFMLRKTHEGEDLLKARNCLQSLEKSTYTKVIVYNQGYWSNDLLQQFLNQFQLEYTIIGAGENVGIIVGRQACFTYIWERLPQAKMISELHLDMIFTHNWEDPLVAYLSEHDQSVISCGIVDKNSDFAFLGPAPSKIPNDFTDMDTYLKSIKNDLIVPGFAHPCIHQADVLRHLGGYDSCFLPGKQAFEDDCILLGYFYYHGTRANWTPKVCYHSVVYHECAGQRTGVQSDIMINYYGLEKLYGAMGIKHLSHIHKNAWSKNFFEGKYIELRNAPVVPH